MKQYTIEHLLQKYEDKVHKNYYFTKCHEMTGKSIMELIDLIEQEFDRDGVIFMFLHEYDFSGISDEYLDKFLEKISKNTNIHFKERKLNLSLGEKIKFFFKDLSFWSKFKTKCFISKIQDVILFPFKNYSHIKKYFLPKNISDEFHIHFLIMVASNLKYYMNNFDKKFCDGELEESQKNKIKGLIDYCLAYYTISEQLNSFTFDSELGLFTELSEESFRELQTTIRNVKNIIIEKNHKLLSFIQEDMYF